MADLQEVNILKQVYEQNRKRNLLAVDRYYAAMFNEDISFLTYVVVIEKDISLGENKMPKPRKLMGGKSLPDSMSSSKSPLLIPDVQYWLTSDTLSSYIDFENVPCSFMGIPLIVGDKTIGALVVESDKKSAYNDSDMNLFATMAGQIVVALENVRAYKRLQELHIRIAQTQEIITQNVIAQDFVHRINNLAGTIPVWIDLLKENLYPSDPRDEKIMEYLSLIEKDTDQLLYAAAELKRPIRDEKIDIKLLIESMLDSVRIQYPGIKCVQNITPEFHFIISNYFQLSSVIWNIISNALESMPEAGTLTVNVKNIIDSNDMTWVEIFVEDTGGGIPANVLQKLFEPFSSTKGVGRGYGLWRSKNFIEGLGGKIQLTSELQKGTTVVMTIPVLSK